MKSSSRLLAALATLGGATLLASTASATLVVDLQPSTTWVAGNTNGRTVTSVTNQDQNGDSVIDSRSQVAFSASSALGPSTPGTQSSQFYGGMVAYKLSSTSNLFGNNRVWNGADAARPDAYELGSTASTDVARGALFWKEADYLGGGGNLTITKNDAFTFTGYSINTPTAQFQWLVQIGSTYYVSNETFTAVPTVGDTPVVRTSQNLLSTTWAAIDLDAALSNYAAPSLSYGALDLGSSDIGAVGVYFSTTGTSTNGRFRLAGFQADLAAIPEPSTAAALAGLGILGFAASCRRRRA